MTTENRIDCPAMHKRSNSYPFGERVPRTVQMLKTVTPDPMPGIGLAYIKGSVPIASAGQSYHEWTNSHGAVSAVMPDGERLGLRPAEFEVDTWNNLCAHPDADEAYDLLAATSLEAGERIDALEKECDTLRNAYARAGEREHVLRLQLTEANDLLKKLADIDMSAIDFDHDHWQYLLGEVSLQLHTTEDWRMNPCKQGHRDVGAAGGSAHCYQCGEEIVAATTQIAFEQWNATHPAASTEPEVKP